MRMVRFKDIVIVFHYLFKTRKGLYFQTKTDTCKAVLNDSFIKVCMLNFQKRTKVFHFISQTEFERCSISNIIEIA